MNTERAKQFLTQKGFEKDGQTVIGQFYDKMVNLLGEYEDLINNEIIYKPSELIILKNYYDMKWSGSCSNQGGCKTEEQTQAKTISAKIEKRLEDIANTL